jgi:hypothetical protein
MLRGSDSPRATVSTHGYSARPVGLDFDRTGLQWMFRLANEPRFQMLGCSLTRSPGSVTQ